MSKFIDDLEVILTGNRSAAYSPLGVKMENTNKDYFTHTQLDEYVLQVIWKVIVNCEKGDLSDIKRNVISELKNYLFGDLRVKILQLERSLYEHDYKQTKKLINDILEETY